MQVVEVKAKDSGRVACKLVYLLKRFTDQWMGKRLCRGDQPEFNSAHLPLLMSIGTNGISNNELAAKLNVTKQATSKIVKELETIQMVKSEKSEKDARVAMLYLTNNGENLYYSLRNQMEQLEDEYKKVVGAKNYEIAIDVMLKLIKFHEEHNCI
jgi:DNA-binding MarR family transcriptional regulator